MIKRLLVLLLIPFLMGAAPTRLFTYIPNTTIESSKVTANEDALFQYLQAGVEIYANDTIVNADVKTSAAISDTKLDLATIAQDMQFNGASVFAGNVTFASQTIADLGTATTGIFTAIDIDSGSLTNVILGSGIVIEDADINTPDIDGGTANDLIIGGSSAAAGTFTNVTADGTINFAGATVSDLGTVTTADINGGTLDGVQVGGTTSTGEILVNNSSDAADGLGSQGTARQVLQSQGSGSNPIWTDSFVQVSYTSTGNFLVPAAVTQVFLSMCAGGGGGGASEGGGGGGGECVVNFPFTVTPAASLDVTVGALGAKGLDAGGNGTAGGDTSFSTVTVSGGAGGSGGASGAGGAGGGGQAASGTTAGSGGIGGGAGAAGSGGSGGGGGASILGDGGAGAGPGAAGSAYGGGGGGGDSGNDGGNGAAGFVLVVY